MFRFPDDKSEISEIFGYGVEITERVRSEVELRRSRGHLMRAQSIARLGSVEVDLATLRYQISEEANRIFGVGGAEIKIFRRCAATDYRRRPSACPRQYGSSPRRVSGSDRIPYSAAGRCDPAYSPRKRNHLR
jgi:hypothetical protein